MPTLSVLQCQIEWARNQFIGPFLPHEDDEDEDEEEEEEEDEKEEVYQNVLVAETVAKTPG